MDAERYARVRELFLAVEDLPADQQLNYLQSQCDGDQALVEEVVSLLDEHDTESALREGESAKPPTLPESPPILSAANQDGSSTPNDESSSDSSASNAAAPFMPGAQRSPDDGAADNSSAQSPGKQRPSILDSPRQRRQPIAKPSGKSGAEETRHGAQRTHASPRYRNEPSRPSRPPSSEIWQTKQKRHRRFNSGWLWIATLAPTILIGWLTYSSVIHRLNDSVQQELVGVAQSVQYNVTRFLNDQATLTETWARAPEVRSAIAGLVETTAAKNPIESPPGTDQQDIADALRQSPHTAELRRQLIFLARSESVKYVVWDRTGMIIASWLSDGADLGANVAPDGAGNLAQAMRGETVLFGPEILQSDGSGFVPETDAPVMATIMPVQDARGRVIATILIRGIDLYANFNRIIDQASVQKGLDVYAINHAGLMISQNPRAREHEGADVACKLRVSAPTREDEPDSNTTTAAFASQRKSQPLTYAAAGASSGQSGERLQPYANYLGTDVVGAWRWIGKWQIGIIVEQTSHHAFATATYVQWSFLSLALILSITVLIAASQIAKRTTLAQAAVHPLSRYELTAELGSGGMGVVYRARHAQLGRDTALKVLRGDRDNVEDRLRFDREAKLASSLSNPHTVTIYDYGRGDEGEAYCVMEFLKGITLYDVVARSGLQPYGRTLFILRQICESLGEAHKLRLVHRDVKPQNVMLSLDASIGDWAVVFDFGLAKPLQPDSDAYQTAETIWAGTPMYMAPERYREPNKIDPRSDIYSLGCVAYFLLTGRPPFIECDPESLFALVLAEEPISLDVHRDEQVPVEIDQLVKKSMAKNVNERFSTIEEMALELDRLIAAYPWSVEQARHWWRIHGDDA